MGQFDHLNNVIPINLKFGMHSDIEGAGRDKITTGDMVIGFHEELNTASLYFATGNNGTCKAAIMPPPGFGMLCGLGYNSSPFYAYPSFQSKQTTNSATIEFYGTETYENNNQVNYGTSMLITDATIPGASELLAGLMTAQTTQSFSGNKTFRGYFNSTEEIINGSPNTINGTDYKSYRRGGITLYDNLVAEGVNRPSSDDKTIYYAPQINFKWTGGTSGTVLLENDGIFKILNASLARGSLDTNIRANTVQLRQENNLDFNSGAFYVWDDSTYLILGGTSDTKKSKGVMDLYDGFGHYVQLRANYNADLYTHDIFIDLPSHNGNGVLVTLKPENSGINTNRSGYIPFLDEGNVVATTDECKPYGDTAYYSKSRLSWLRGIKLTKINHANGTSTTDEYKDLGITALELGGSEQPNQKDNDYNTLGQLHLHLGSYYTGSETIDKKFIIAPPKDYRGATHGTGNISITLPERIKSNKIYFFDANQQLTDGFTIEEIDKELTIVDKGHFINNTKIAVNSTTEPTENFYVNGTIGMENELDGNTGRTITFPPRYSPCKKDGTNPENSTCIIFDFGSFQTYGARRICIEITGHSYDSRQLHSIYEFYVGSKNNYQASGECFGCDTGNLVIYREQKNLKAYLAFSGANMIIQPKVYIYSPTLCTATVSYQQPFPIITDVNQKTIVPYTNNERTYPNRVIYRNVTKDADVVTANKITYSNHYIDHSKLYINQNSVPKYLNADGETYTAETAAFYVNGLSKFKGNIVPEAVQTRDIGSSLLNWRSTYVNTYYIYNNKVSCGKLYTSTEDSATNAPKYTYLELGNSTGAAAAAGRAGLIRLYSTNSYYNDIKARSSLTQQGSTFFLPAGDENQDECYAVWSPESATAIGSTTLPVYVDAKGKVVACTASSVFSDLSWTAGTANGPTLSVTVAGQNRTSTIPSASSTASGIITTGAQTFAGDKTFNNKIILKSGITYGTQNPEDIYTSDNPATEGQIYFKIIS